MPRLDPADYRAGQVLGHELEIMKLQPGDVLICRPRDPLSQAQTESIHNKLSTMAGSNPNIRIMLVPSTWDIALGRSAEDEDAIEGLRGLIDDLSR